MPPANATRGGGRNITGTKAYGLAPPFNRYAQRSTRITRLSADLQEGRFSRGAAVPLATVVELSGRGCGYLTATAYRHRPFSASSYCSRSVSKAWISAVFNRYASKPAARHASRMTSSPYAVRAIRYGRRLDGDASRSRRARSSPVMSCKQRSRMAQSGWKLFAIESAVSPLSAAATSCPINSTKRTMSCLTSSLSSTTTTFLDRWATALRWFLTSRWKCPKTDYGAEGSRGAYLCSVRGTCTLSVVPKSRFDSSFTIPFISRTRSSILRRPRPV